MISANVSRVSGFADEESCGSSRPNASTSSGVAVSATVTSTDASDVDMRAGYRSRSAEGHTPESFDTDALLPRHDDERRPSIDPSSDFCRIDLRRDLNAVGPHDEAEQVVGAERRAELDPPATGADSDGAGGGRPGRDRILRGSIRPDIVAELAPVPDVDTGLVLGVHPDGKIREKAPRTLRHPGFGVVRQIRVEVHEIVVEDVVVGRLAVREVPDRLHDAAGSEVPVGERQRRQAVQTFPQHRVCGECLAKSHRQIARLRQRHVVVFADALEHEEHRRGVAAVGHEMRSPRRDRVGLARIQAHLFLRIAQKQAQAALQDVERVLDVVVIVPGHLLSRADLDLLDAKARPLGMPGAALDLVEVARVLHRVLLDRFHGPALLLSRAMVPSRHRLSGRIAMGQDLLEVVKDGVAVLTLNRPERLNAMSGPMLDALLEALPRLAADAAVGVVVLTGAGRGFCAGGDVKVMAEGREFAETGLEDKAHGLRSKMEVSRLLHEMPKPTIAMVRGAAAGAGLSMALACDLRVAGERAKFATAFARVGYSGDFGGSWVLTQLVGSLKARELYYTAEIVDAKQPLALGIANRVVPDERLEDETLALARKLAQGPRVALRYMKRNMNAAETQTLAQCLDLEAMHP